MRILPSITRIGVVIAVYGLSDTVAAQTEIHKCTADDGGVIYSQLPCASKAPVEENKTEPEEELEATQPVFVQRELPVTEDPREASEPKAGTAACKKRYRDAIDEIDAEIGREYSREKAEQYKQRLLTLTRKLRQC